MTHCKGRIREGLEAGVTFGDTSLSYDLLSAFGDDLEEDPANRVVAADLGEVRVSTRNSKKVVGLAPRRDILRVRARVILEDVEQRRILNLSVTSRLV